MATYTFAWAVPGQSHVIDCIDDATGLTRINKQDEAAIKARYPDAVKVNLTDFALAQGLACITQPEEITKERFHEMLEVLPPKHWRGFTGGESFQMIEHERGRITGTYVRVGKRYFTFKDQEGMAAEAVREKVINSAAFKAGQ